MINEATTVTLSLQLLISQHSSEMPLHRKGQLSESTPDHFNNIMSLIKAEGRAIESLATNTWPAAWRLFGPSSLLIPWILCLCHFTLPLSSYSNLRAVFLGISSK